MLAYADAKENLLAQVNELEALESVYPKELVIADHGVLADINTFIRSSAEDPPQRLEYSIDLTVTGGTLALLISLPSNYPKEKPEAYARSSSLNRAQQLLLNKALCDLVEQQEEGEPCIYVLVSWLQDNGEDYILASQTGQRKEEKKKEEGGGREIFARYWIYSHHIYSKFKRRDIAGLAKEYSITGFCLAGKPGIVCMEGALEDCDYCWQKIRAMNWHRILIRLLEKDEECKDIAGMRKFTDFQEVSFPTFERHNDMGRLLKYLTEHDSQYAFKELFGIEGKSTELADDR